MRVQVVAGSGQLKRLEEISDGNVDCFVEAVVLIFVPFEAWVGGRMRSGMVWLVVVKGRSASRDV